MVSYLSCELDVIVSSTPGGSTLNLVTTGLVAFEEMFETVIP